MTKRSKKNLLFPDAGDLVVVQHLDAGWAVYEDD